MKNHLSALLAIIITLAVASVSAQTKVSATSKPAAAQYSINKLEIKTYEKDLPDPNPRYYEGLDHQGVQRHPYPYRMEDNLTDRASTKTYDSEQLENEYIKINIIPELGGRVYSATDKTNNYEFLYRNVVIKPSLIGMAGSWISGGLAWGFPHHHGPLTMAPYEHREVANADGSKTVWVAKTDYATRMRIRIGMTVFPGKSYLQVEVFLDNRTPLVNSFLYWANPAVKADPSYQIYFGPSVQWAAYHHKADFVRWPIGDASYMNTDYAGVNVSLWRNIKIPASFFCWQTKDDFIAGYSHSGKAGTAYVGNHHILPGMKVWEDGDNPDGNARRGSLTDNEDEYIEMMAGGFSDNEPDYSWIQPYEVKHFKQYWFPVRDLDGIDLANLNGALSFRLDEKGQARVAINTTSVQQNARMIVKAKGTKLLERTVTISPDKPFAESFPVEKQYGRSDLEVSVVSAQGQELLHFQPLPEQNTNLKKPDPVAQPGKPEDFKTVEELYLAGLRLDQFFNAHMESNPYFAEALKRDPGNYELNVWLGIKASKNMDWAEAESRFRTALERITNNYTRPKDGEAFYYLGVALRAQGRYDEAYDQFYNAVWSSAWHGAGYFALAGLDCRKGDFAEGLEHIDNALTGDATSPEFLVLKAMILRKAGRLEEAAQLATEVSEKNVLNFQSRNEVIILDRKNGKDAVAKLALADLDHMMQGDEEAYTELALEYANNGFPDEAIDVLSRFAALPEQAKRVNPMIDYYLGYLWEQKGDGQKASYYYGRGSRERREYVFPYRDESRVVLEHARQANPKDSLAPYLLGDLLYEHQPKQAIDAWETARSLDPAYARVHRNLAWGYRWYEKDCFRASTSLEQAIKLDSSDARYLYELDVAYECAKTPLSQRLAMLEQHRATVEKRDDATSRLATLLVLSGRYDEALQILTTRHFRVWENMAGLPILYQDAVLLRGLARLKNHDAQGALDDFLKADQYRPNLEIGKPLKSPRFAQVSYLIGLGYEAVGDANNARQYFLRAVAENADDTEYLYYQGLAFKKLGQPQGADQMFTKLEALAKKKPVVNIYSLRAVATTAEQDDAHAAYVRALAYAGKGLEGQAHEEFAKALSIDSNVSWYRYFLDNGGL